LAGAAKGAQSAPFATPASLSRRRNRFFNTLLPEDIPRQDARQKIGSRLQGQVPLALDIDTRGILDPIGQGAQAQNDAVEGGLEMR
jgi:hypothetical protein